MTKTQLFPLKRQGRDIVDRLAQWKDAGWLQGCSPEVYNIPILPFQRELLTKTRPFPTKRRDRTVIGLLGGTFDPIHYGHLRMALVLYQTLHFNHIRFIPCQQPVLKNVAKTSAEHRLAMIKLAIAGQRGFIVDERELHRNAPSYTWDTLISLREELGDQQPLCWIIGSDAFIDFASWYRWQHLLDLAHIVVVHRPGYEPPTTGPVAELLHQHQINDYHLLHRKPGGHLLLYAALALEISSTDIREQITHQISPRYLLPDKVLRYIKQHRLYVI